MGKTNFQTLKNLANSLSKKLDKMSEGQLHLNDIEALTEEAREIYERIVIIRFKSYEALNEPSNDITEEPNQAETVTDVEEEIETEIDDEGMMMFDFTTNTIDSQPESEEPVNQLPKTETDDSEKKIIGAENNDPSLNDNFKKEEGSVANKFEKAAIADLKEHIGINRKFLYINDLFNGDSEAYNSAIEDLNSHQSMENALEHVSSLKAKYGWNDDNTAVAGFIEIIERRYIL